MNGVPVWLRLRPYAASPTRWAWQLLADVAVVLIIVESVRLAHRVHDAVAGLAAPGLRLERGADGLAGALGRAASGARRVPFVGGRLATPLRGADSSAGQVADAGAALAGAANELAGVLGLTVAVVPIAVVLVLWLPVRLRFAVRAGRAGAALAGLDPDAARRLLAVRFLASGPIEQVADVGADPVTAVAQASPAVLEALAARERSRLGLPPLHVRTPVAR